MSERQIGYFSPKFLWALQPFVDWQRKHHGLQMLTINGSIFLEPAPPGFDPDITLMERT